MTTVGLFSYSPAVCSQDLHTNRTLIIKDATYGGSLPGANLTFRCLDDCDKVQTLTYLLSDSLGQSVVPYYGDVEVIVAYIGYNSIVDTIPNGFNEYTISISELEFLAPEIIATAQSVPLLAEESVHDVKIISSERIKQQNAFSLREVLISEAGIQISQDGVSGSGISINGVSGENVKILMDGVPLVGRVNGQVDISQINLSNIERIEIIEGPMSTIYGSNALGGVINLITKKGKSEGIGFRFNTVHEIIGGQAFQPHQGIYNFDAGLDYGISDFNFVLNGGRNFFGGMQSDNSSRNQVWNPKEQYFIDFNASYKLNKDNTLTYISNFFNETLINKGSLIQPIGETAFDDYFYTDRYTNSLQYVSSDFFGSELNAVLSHSYFNRERNNYVKNLVNLEKTLSTDDTKHDTTVFDNVMFRAFYSLPKFSESTDIQIGTELNFDRVIGERILGAEGQSIEDYAAFISIEQEFGDLTVQPALRYINNSRYEAPLVPSLNLRYALDEVTIRGSVSSGFRAPSIKELYLFFVDVNHNIQGNPNLQAETSVNAALSADYQILLGEGENVNAFKISPKGFYNHITDMITLSQDINDPTLFSYFNLSDFTSAGAGIELGLISDNYSVTTSYLISGQRQRISNNDFFFSNEVALNVSYDIDAIDLTLATNTKYNGERVIFLDGGDQILQGTMPSFLTSDVSASYMITDGFKLNTGVRNLFDVTNLQTGLASGGVHSSGGSMPIAWGRTFYLGLSYD